MMMRIWTTRELYPPECPAEIVALLDGLLTNDRDLGGKVIIRREITESERRTLLQRRALLEPWLHKSRNTEIQVIVMAMLTGFGSKPTTEQEAAIQAMQFAYTVGSLPLWAIKRACDRFANGSVKPEEVDVKKIDWRYPPSTAQLYTVARAIALPVVRECHRINALLHGAAMAQPETPEERARNAVRIEEIHDDFRARMAQGHLEEIEREEKRRETIMVSGRARSLEARRREYADAGLVPPAPGPDGIITSLSMMLKNGYTIQEFPDGQNALVAPPKRDPGPVRQRPTATNQMGS